MKETVDVNSVDLQKGDDNDLLYIVNLSLADRQWVSEPTVLLLSIFYSSTGSETETLAVGCELAIYFTCSSI